MFAFIFHQLSIQQYCTHNLFDKKSQLCFLNLLIVVMVTLCLWCMCLRSCLLSFSEPRYSWKNVCQFSNPSWKLHIYVKVSIFSVKNIWYVTISLAFTANKDMYACWKKYSIILIFELYKFRYHYVMCYDQNVWYSTGNLFDT